MSGVGKGMGPVAMRPNATARISCLLAFQIHSRLRALAHWTVLLPPLVRISAPSPPLQLVYSSSKAALDHAARIQALELGPHQIRVNTVRPTVVLTKLALENWAEDKLAAMKAAVPLGTLPQPADVAQAVAWLLSDHSRFVTGASIPVDGGRSMGGNGL